MKDCGADVSAGVAGSSSKGVTRAHQVSLHAAFAAYGPINGLATGAKPWRCSRGGNKALPDRPLRSLSAAVSAAQGFGASRFLPALPPPMRGSRDRRGEGGDVFAQAKRMTADTRNWRARSA